MERTVMKEGVCGTNMFDFGSKSSIGPKSDNYVNAIEMKETDKCRHFSIRAYVAEVRIKDWKICWPFPPLVDNEQSKKESDMLPPLHVPEFRWWGCQNCLQRSDASASSLKICGSRNSDVNTSVDLIGSDVCPLTHEHMEGKVANVMSITRQDLLSSENYSKTVVKEVDKTMREPISSEMKVAQVINGEFCKGAETINLNLENSGLVEFGDANCGSSEVDKGMLKCPNNSCTLVFQKEKVVDFKEAKPSEQVEDMKRHQKPELRTLENEEVGFRARQLSPLELNENDYDNAAHGYSSPILSSRKAQKFRLLSEILGRDDSGSSTKISSSNGKTRFHGVNNEVTRTKSADEPDGLGLDTPSTAQISVGENGDEDTAGRKKKRKALQIQDQEQRMRCSNSVSTNVQICKSDKEDTCIDSAIAHSKSVDEAFVSEGLYGVLGSHQRNENGSERNVIQGKRKNKTSQHSNDGSTGRGIHHSLSLNMAAQGLDLNPGVFNDEATRRKDVMSDMKTSVVVAEGDRSTTCHDVNCRITKMDMVPAKTSHEKASKRGLNSFVNYCMGLEETDEESALKNQKHEVHGVGNGNTSLITHSRVIPKEDHILSKEIGRTTQVASGTGSHLGLKTKKATSRKADSYIKHNNMSQLQDGALKNQKHEVHGVGNGNTSLITHSRVIPKEDHILSKEIGRTTQVASGTGSHLGLKTKKATSRKADSYIKHNNMSQLQDGALKNQKHEVHGVGNGNTSLITHSRVIPKEDHILSKEIGRTTQVASGTGSHLGLKTKKATSRKAYSYIKHNNMSQLQDGASPIWSKDLSFINGWEKNTDVQGHSEAITQRNGRANKTNELESLNGIPVEIVELLAKNRHERLRLEAEKAKENKLCMLKKTKNAMDSEKSEFRGLHNNEMPRYPSGENLKMCKPRSNAVSSISGAGTSVIVAPMEGSIAYSSHLMQPCKSSGSKMKQSEESHETKGAFAFSDPPVDLSSGNQLSKVCTSKNFGVQSCRCDGDKLVNGGSNSSFQCLTSCQKHRIVSSPTQIRGAHHVSLPNVADCPSGIVSSQKSANLTKRPNMNFHSETSGKIHKGQPCACTQKKIGNCPNPVGQLELCTNEIMPATQLLKLMDSGTSSKVPKNVVVNMEFTKQPSFPQTTPRKWIFPLNEGLCRDYGVGKSSGYFAFSGQRDKNCFGRSQILGRKMVNDSVKSTGMKKRKSSDCLTADCKLHRFGDGSGSLREKQESFPIDGLKAEFHPHLRSMIVASNSHLMESSIENAEMEKKLGTIGLVKSSCGMVEELHICSLNRNPADFSIPEAGNEFTTRGGDFKFRKQISKRGRPRLRMMKLQAIKESAQH